MATRKLGVGRLVIGLPERYEKAKEAIKRLEWVLSLVQGEVNSRHLRSDTEVVDAIKEILDTYGNR